MTIPALHLNDGRSIPQLGFGVFKVDPAETERIVSDALEAGYRHIDTAAIYANEEGVGRAIAASGIPRDELWITTKLWNSDQVAGTASEAIATSLDKLGLDRVDLYLIHWPRPDADRYVDAWTRLIGLRDEGLATSIGVSNFTPVHLDRVIGETGQVPSVDQVELHPGFAQKELRAYAAEQGIAIESWGPLGQGKYPLLDEEAVVAAAAAHAATPAQVVLAWHLARGLVVIPKTVSAARMAENFAAAELTLTAAELDAIESIDAGLRQGADPDTAT